MKTGTWLLGGATVAVAALALRRSRSEFQAEVECHTLACLSPEIEYFLRLSPSPEHDLARGLSGTGAWTRLQGFSLNDYGVKGVRMLDEIWARASEGQTRAFGPSTIPYVTMGHEQRLPARVAVFTGHWAARGASLGESVFAPVDLICDLPTVGAHSLMETEALLLKCLRTNKVKLARTERDMHLAKEAQGQDAESIFWHAVAAERTKPPHWAPSFFV